MASNPEPPTDTATPPNPTTASNPSKPRPFPAITGACVCTAIRYRLLTSPLFYYACHCRDCQKTTGSAFGLYLNIEAHYISVLSPLRPSLASRPSKSNPSGVHQFFECAQCKTELWTTGLWSEGVCDVRVGTLDFPSLMEPDVHSFVESKVEWVRLPEGARVVQKGFGRELWPKVSLKRLEICKKRIAEAKVVAAAQAKRAVEGESEDAGGEGEKTPTAVEFEEGETEDDEAFEKRFKETERALHERLERLTLKLEGEGEGEAKVEKSKGSDEPKGASAT